MKKQFEIKLKKLLLLFMTFFVFVTEVSNAQTTMTYSTPGTYTWTCPAGVTTVKVECWGAGGGG